MSWPFGYSLYFYKAYKLIIIFNSFKCHETVGHKRVMKATFVITKVIQNNKIFCVS